MIDNSFVPPAEPEKRRPGRPRTRTTSVEREPIRTAELRQTDIRSQMTAAPNWDTMDEDYANEQGIDRFHIPKDMIPDGMDMQWVTDSVYGQPQQIRSQFERGGWTPVHHQDFGGRFDGKWGTRGQTGEINSGGLVLMTRPMELSAKSRARERRAALEPMKIKEDQLYGQGVDVVGGDHPSARKQNSIRKTWEPTIAAIPIPRDEE